MNRGVAITSVIIVFVMVISLVVLKMNNVLGTEPIYALFGVIIGAIVPSLFQSISSESDRKNQLRLAGLSERLRTHQEAYSLWRKLLCNGGRDEIMGVTKECQEWWDNNCIYLSEDARKAFYKAFHSASDHLLSMKNKESAALIKQQWTNVVEAGRIIVAGVNLPSIGNEEKT
jgi:hypothetical protein